MSKRYAPINPKCTHMLHGGDYNPDQWINTPEIWDEDMRLMKLSGCNAMSIGIFGWAALEPEEGKYTFDWMDEIMDKLAANDAYAVLATPSGAKPVWMSEKYPEIRRMDKNGVREVQHGRHNHCRTSPVYREKCVAINTLLAERYKDHPALLVWHVSNEYNGGECHCPHCIEAFQGWLREKYHDDLGELNHQWWTAFWASTYTKWEHIRPVDTCIHGLMLDWRRFLTAQTIDFFNAESAPLRQITPDVPVTTNFMGLYDGLNYWDFARAVDVISWDSYPAWHDTEDDVAQAVTTAFIHDMNRSMKSGKPWMLMESVPSVPSRGVVRKRKRPGMNLLSSLQAVAHGSDTVQYFQWRKGRGGSEKFHGAVVDHVGTEHTRVFKDVTQVGDALKSLDDVVGTSVEPQVAIMFDWENRWAMDSAVILGNNTKYGQTCISHYRPFWEAGIPVDVIDETCDISKYKLVIAPMLYLLRAGIAEKLKHFVQNGGTAVSTYWSAIVNENDLCYLGGTPGGGLREVFGIWDEELDSLQPFDRNGIAMGENDLGMTGSFEARELCSIIHCEGARVLGTYTDDFYAGQPALTVNDFGRGKAYFMATRCDDTFLAEFYNGLANSLQLTKALDTTLPAGVTAQVRGDFVFLMNFSTDTQSVELDSACTELLTGETVGPQIELSGYEVRALKVG